MVDIKTHLKKSNGIVFSVYAIIASFSTYSCMYAFRKPFAVATFDGLNFAGVDYKVWLIIAQVLGYTLSKFTGIKIVSELEEKNRAGALLLLITFAGISLLFFAITPAPYNIIFLFINGLPLGMVWGIVFSYLEGRRFTEVLGAGLSVSFIFSSGFVKSIGKYLILSWGVSEFWMPFLTSVIFIVPLFISVWLLNKIPPPSKEDERLRTKREPMDKVNRSKFMKEFSLGLAFLIIAYMFLTAFRDFRDNFAAEIWQALGYGGSAEIFTVTEIPIAFGILVVIGSLFLIKDNKKALIINHIIILIGIAMVGISTFSFESGWIDAPLWMILVGFGLYLGYVPFNSVLFERLIATFRCTGNVGFVIYLADSFGYLGSVGVLLYKEFGYTEISWLHFFITTAYMLSIIGSLLIIASLIYFYYKYRKHDEILEKKKIPKQVVNSILDQDTSHIIVPN